MKGYYTVKLTGGDLPVVERIALETRYVEALELALGGTDRVRELCLAAATATPHNTPPALDPRLLRACEHAESAAWGARVKADGARFALAAWSAADL